MKRKLSILDWMLAIDFDNPQLLRLAKELENTQDSYVYIFLGSADGYVYKPKKPLSCFNKEMTLGTNRIVASRRL